MHDSLASYDPLTSSWRTSQLSLVADLEMFSETWPRSGTMRGGIAYPLPPLAPLTGATGSGLLPTPEASNTKALAMRSGGRSPRNFLAPLPTPRCGGGNRNSRTAIINDKGHPSGKSGLGLEQAAEVLAGIVPKELRSIEELPPGWQTRFPTPTTKDASGARNATCDVVQPERLETGGQLNPTWVEWLMGFPLGWTACMASVTPSSRKSWKS